VSSLLAHARKQEISLPVARLLVLAWAACQHFKPHIRWSLPVRRARALACLKSVSLAISL
jgi:hypothetical protein